MSEKDIKTKEAAALWRAARQGWHSPADDGAPEAMLLAAYLDGELAEDEAARLEARLAGDAPLLDEVLALRETLRAGPEAAPAGVQTRAQAAFPERPAMRIVESAGPSLLDRLFGFRLSRAMPAFAALALLLACAGAFELGRYQATQLNAETQSVETADSDVPAEFVLGGLL